MRTRPAPLFRSDLAAALLLAGIAACSGGPRSGSPASAAAQATVGGELLLQRGAAANVDVLALSPGGALLAADGPGGEVMLWDAQTGGFLGRLHTGLEYLIELRFSPTRERLLARGAGAVELWDLTTRARVDGFDPPPEHDRAVFSPSGNELLSWGSSSRCGLLWTPGSTVAARKLGAADCDDFDAASITAAAFAPDGRQIALARGSGVEVWGAGGERLRRFDVPARTLWDVTFSSDGARIITVADETVAVWSASDGGRLHQVLLDSLMPRSVAAVPGASQVLVRGDHGTALLDVITGRVTPLSGRSDAAVPGTPGVVAFEEGDSVRLLDADDRRPIGAAPILNPNGSWAVSGDGRRLASTWSGAIQVRALDDPTDEPLLLFDGVIAPGQIRASPIGDVVAAIGRKPGGSADQPGVPGLYTWDLRTGEALWSTERAETGVSDFAFSPDGRTIAITAFDPGLPLLRLANTGERLRELADVSYLHVLYDPGGGFVVLSGPSVVLVDPGTGEVVRVLRAPRADALSPDGHLLAAVRGNVRLWDVRGDSLLREIGPADEGLRLHGPDIAEAEFHPDGGRILTGGFILQPTVYDVSSGDTLATYPVPAPMVSDMVAVYATYSPDGARVLTRIESGVEAWLLDAAASPSSSPGTVFRSDSGILHAVFSPDGRYLIATHADASTRVWDVRTGTEIFRRFILDADDWLVITPDGRYDGTPGGIRQLRRVDGSRSTPVDPGADPGHVEGLVAELVG